MTVRWIATRLLVAVALVAAAITLAPANALAHAGHHHGPPVAKPEAVTPTQVVRAQVESPTARVPASVNSSAYGYWVAASPAADGKTICLAGCCAAASSGCCALSLSNVPGLDPPWPGKRAVIVEEVGGAGIDPGALPEPPKFLA